MRGTRLIWAILAVALTLRLVSVVTAATYGQPFGDAQDYDRIAVALADTGRFPPTLYAAPGSPTALRPPTYPLLLAAIYKLGGRSLDAVLVVNALLGTLAVALLYLLVARVFDRQRALLAAGLAAVLPALVVLPNALLSENLFVPLVLGALLLVAVHRERGGLWPAVGAGLLVGAAAMTRSNGLLLALPVLIGLGTRRSALVAAVCLAVALTPWTIRNAAAFHRFLPLGTQSGFTIAGVWNGFAQKPGPKRAEWQFPFSVPEYANLFNRPGIDEGDIDGPLRTRALDYAKAHPPIILQTFAIDLGRTFGIHPGHASLDDIAYTEMGVAPSVWPWLRVTTWALLALALAGAVVVVRRRLLRETAWLWLALVLLILGYVVWLGTPRYRVPADPLLIVLAVQALATAMRSSPATSPSSTDVASTSPAM